ncbi:cytochrome c biogenesis protein ResB [Calidifontibacter sp. DB0510]|uniref:Cytochrome c biogenesis protein ResB n=2 Tax=Metallococcus carri TaxID=1656884 RepID=A0A967B0T0_9MICO|nr:cytochrome c biogenesis protein ResB [Metallococcus carri]NOP36387.1 cytochrome c biogenesis protein ResB [Calidifontibacter sp. DB2511S]
MRTALFLLLMLSVAAVPGSIFPQRGISAQRVTTYLDQHKTAGPILDKIGLFDVYTTPWFAAIYLLLVVSLLGCVIPRIRLQAKTLRAPVPKVPRRLSRLAGHVEREVAAPPQEVLAAARAALSRRRYRLREDAVAEGAPLELAAEGGRMRETGNLLFHLCLIIVIIALALGRLLGWRGDVIVPVGSSFSSVGARYDTLQPGAWVDTAKFEPWSMKVNNLDVEFEDQVDPSSAQWGQPRHFTASVTTSLPGQAPRQRTLGVNSPLAIGGASVFLLGNGYAPRVTVRDAKGTVLYDEATPFLPQDNTYRSVGAIKVPAASPKQLGFFGFFLPTAAFSKTQGPVSIFPDTRAPALVLGLYEGTLFPGGRPQSVYTLDTASMSQVKDTKGQPLRILLRQGQTYQLPGGRGSISFDNAPRWAGLSIRSDPGKMPALAGALLGLLGLVMSMSLRRRRIFLRVTPEGAGSRLQIGGLAKGDDPRLQVALEQLADTIGARAAPPRTLDPASERKK